MNPIKALTPTYEPETESRESLNHMIAEQNKLILSLMKEIEFLNKRLEIKTDTNILLNSTIESLEQINTNQLDVIGMYQNEINRLEQEK